MNLPEYIVIFATVVAVVVLAFHFFGGGGSSTSTVTSYTTTLNTTTTSVPQNITTGPTFSNNVTMVNTSWISTSEYPIPVNNEKCLSLNNQVYCIGGLMQSSSLPSTFVYYAPVTQNGLGTWNLTASVPFVPASCVTHGNQIYCISGFVSINRTLVYNATYITNVTGDGAGGWAPNLAYPRNGTTTGCTTSSLQIFCIGGKFANDTLTNKSFYATFTGSGISSWHRTTPFPIAAEPQCYQNAGTIYCIGALNGSNYAYYATATLQGLSSWSSANLIQNITNPSCSFYKATVYCWGNSAYLSGTQMFYSSLTKYGFGGWHQILSYPIDINAASCTSTGNRTYCIGGIASNGSYAQYVGYTQLIPFTGT